MMLFANFQESLRNLTTSKLRSLLALLGVLVGTASVVAMISGGQLATQEALKQFKSLGTDLLAISINDSATAQSETKRDLTLRDAMGVQSSQASIVMVAPYATLYSPIRFSGHEVTGGILGVTENFARMTHLTLQRGRFISNLDGYGYYCVIGHDIYQQLKKMTLVDPIGKQLQIGNAIFTIVGVAAPWPENGFVYASVDRSILLPILASSIVSQYAVINNILMQLMPNADLEKVNRHVEKYFAEVAPSKKLYIRSAKELITSMKKQSAILTILLALIGGVSLLVGGIGVMNIMLVSVVERRREIGIRMAIGATPTDIRWLFLMESVTLTVIGGVLGVLIGVAISYVIALSWHWAFTLFLLPPAVGFLVSVATGVFFGLYPAYRASTLDPIAALRSE